jgi:signal transduction histidine kinase
MGLYLIKKVADYLEHKIEIDTEVGVGTSFRIIFIPSQNLTKM